MNYSYLVAHQRFLPVFVILTQNHRKISNYLTDNSSRFIIFISAFSHINKQKKNQAIKYNKTYINVMHVVNSTFNLKKRETLV